MKIDAHLLYELEPETLQAIADTVTEAFPTITVLSPHPLLLRFDCPNVTDLDDAINLADEIAPYLRDVTTIEEWEIN